MIVLGLSVLNVIVNGSMYCFFFGILWFETEIFFGFTGIESKVIACVYNCKPAEPGLVTLDRPQQDSNSLINALPKNPDPPVMKMFIV